MKIRIFFSVFFCLIASPALAALTDADLDKIRLIVKEEVKTEIESSEKRMKTYIDTKIDAVNSRIDSVEKQMTFLLNVIYGLIALSIIAIGIPQVIIGWRSTGDRTQQRINQELRDEIEALKRQQIVRS
jgi:hypothetical protein